MELVVGRVIHKYITTMHVQGKYWRSFTEQRPQHVRDTAWGIWGIIPEREQQVQRLRGAHPWLVEDARQRGSRGMSEGMAEEGKGRGVLDFALRWGVIKEVWNEAQHFKLFSNNPTLQTGWTEAWGVGGVGTVEKLQVPLVPAGPGQEQISGFLTVTPKLLWD